MGQNIKDVQYGAQGCTEPEYTRVQELTGYKYKACTVSHQGLAESKYMGVFITVDKLYKMNQVNKKSIDLQL